MSRHWMPLYVADYLADTAHLRAAQSGAYLHLIMHYWKTGGLPDDDDQLASIARVTAAEWRKFKPTLAAFFYNGWRHKRIDAELAHAAEISSKRKDAADAKHAKSKAKADANAPANAELKHTQSQSPSPIEREEGARATLLSTEAAEVSETLLAAGQKEPDDPTAIGIQYAVQAWLNEGIPRDFILERGAQVAHKNVNYMGKAIRSAWIEYRAQPPPIRRKEPSSHGSNTSPIRAHLERRISDLSGEPRTGGIRDASGADPPGVILEG